MPNELAFHVESTITDPAGASLGAFRAVPYDKIRLLCYSPAGTGGGGVELRLSHVESGGAPGLLDRISLIAGSSVNQTYDVPGVVLAVSAYPLADTPAEVVVWIWGHRDDAGVAPDTTTPAPPTGTTALIVQAVLADDAGSAGPGVIISLDGAEVGATDAEGSLMLAPEPGTYMVTAVIPSVAFGAAEATVESGQTTEVTVVVVEQERTVAADLSMLELVNGALALDTTAITLQFTQPGSDQVVPISGLDEVNLRSALTSDPGRDLTSAFTVGADGLIKAVDVTAILTVAAATLSECYLKVLASDDRGFSYTETVVFTPGRFTLQIELVAPPSTPTLSVAGLDVRVHYATGFTYQLVADNQGTVRLSDAPATMATVETQTEIGGSTYIGEAAIAVDANLRLRVRLLGTDDLLNGVSGWETIPMTTPVRVISTDIRAEPAGTATTDLPAVDRLLAASPASASSTVTVTATGAKQNVPTSQAATLSIPKGTAKIVLRYLVSTFEYPNYVRQQSRYNDTWTVQVRASSGAMLYAIARNVNSQLTTPPIWGPFGDTGPQQIEVDTTALTATTDATVLVIAATTNIGDSILPTDVVATLGFEPEIVINGVTPDQVVPTDGASDRFSIPRSGDRNVFQRSIDLTFSKPDDVEITKVRVELLTTTGVPLQTIIDDEAPGTVKVQQIDETTMRVVITFSDIASSVDSVPPPSDMIFYRCTLTGRTALGTEVTSKPKDSGVYFALWRMPDGLARYGQRDIGLDDWAASDTYSWLDTHRALVTRIDDISGEHARDLIHDEHFEGREIDMFHAYTFPGAVNGASNYDELRANVEKALAGDAASTARVRDWATKTRTLFNSLIADADIRKIYYAIGSEAATIAAPVLAKGWAKTLLLTGAYTNPAGIVVTLGIGIWANAASPKLTFNITHNTHIHLNL